MTGWSARATILALAMLLSGCSTLGFYAQAVRGHLDLMTRARPIAEVVADPATPDELKVRLDLALRIRAFASRELGLPDNDSYRRYADLDRPAVVWNVFAAGEFSVEPRQWCFPVAGCVAYRGYFDREQAERHAERLRREEDLQTWVGPVPAYSTLGWFDDPLLNTFIRWPEAELARLIFHELAHQLLYVPGDTQFNESFAVAVELDGVRRWMRAANTPAAGEAYARTLARREAFFTNLLAHRARLGALYRTRLAPEAMRERRAELERDALRDYQAFRERWGSEGKPFDGFDRWFGTGPNNAQLASVALYNQWVPAFEALRERDGGDHSAFYAAVRRVAALPRAERDAMLAKLAPALP
ncbi:MAG: aminopeptidase [Proteobacteria bacterium]|nr:aminopeptidase [Burkholderiales bacterium]